MMGQVQATFSRWADWLRRLLRAEPEAGTAAPDVPGGRGGAALLAGPAQEVPHEHGISPGVEPAAEAGATALETDRDLDSAADEAGQADTQPLQTEQLRAQVLQVQVTQLVCQVQATDGRELVVACPRRACGDDGRLPAVGDQLDLLLARTGSGSLLVQRLAWVEPESGPPEDQLAGAEPQELPGEVPSGQGETPRRAGEELVRSLTPAQIEAFVEHELLWAERTTPIVGISTRQGAAEPLLDPVALARRLGDLAEVVLLVTGEATWALSAALPPRLDVYGGAVRIWWPGLQRSHDPRRHPLLFVSYAGGAEALADRIVQLIQEASGPDLGSADEALVGAPDSQQPSGGSIRGVRPDAWARLAQVYRVGHCVRGQICHLAERWALVELLPGAALFLDVREIDWSPVARPADELALGEVVRVKILTLQPESRRGSVSIRQAYGGELREPQSVVPGGPTFLADAAPSPRATREARGEVASGADEADARVQKRLQEELDAAASDRLQLMQALGATREQAADLRKQLRASQDRTRAIERRATGVLDPTRSEGDYLTAVRIAYARLLSEDDRQRFPLQRLRVGRRFLQSLREIDGIDVEKVIEVCAQVACNLGPSLAGRALHELHAGDGSPLVRQADGAKAWRCSLQDNTPSARRLHYWLVPSPQGATIEFAGVGVHDDFSIAT